MKIEHYVEFYYPGFLFCETESKKVKERDFTKIKLPKGCYGFRFYDIASEKKKEIALTSHRLNISGMFFTGEIWSLQDVKEKLPDSKILISNMECNGWDKVVKTRMGNMLPFEKDDVLLEVSI